MDSLSIFSGKLNERDCLYKNLNENAPEWWVKLENDNSLYIEIRKNDIVDVYYYGGRIAEIKCDGKNEIMVTAHPKYLGEIDTNNTDYYRKRIEKGKIRYDPIYQDCIEWLSDKDRLEQMKRNVEKYYSGISCGEETSEKYMQGDLIINGRDKYIDSEFAHRLYDNQRRTIRFDLVKIEGNRIIFEELKRIGDNRLRTTKGDPEIREQMEKYKEFLEFNAGALTDYYKVLYQIKKKLGLPIPLVKNIDELQIDPNPTLLIINNYDKISPRREERIHDIRSTLDSLNINYRIIE